MSRLHNWVSSFVFEHFHKLLWNSQTNLISTIKWEITLKQPTKLRKRRGRRGISPSIRLDSRRREPWSTIITASASPIPFLSKPPFSKLPKHGDPLLLTRNFSTFKEPGKAHDRLVRGISQEEEETQVSALRLLDTENGGEFSQGSKKQDKETISIRRTIKNRWEEKPWERFTKNCDWVGVAAIVCRIDSSFLRENWGKKQTNSSKLKLGS